jgi:3-isopropylmalate/(R)-2-methylmalate dehydratase small subunit
MKPFRRISSRIVPLLERDIDTDQIIPARFLKVTTREGLGDHLFEDLRRNPDGSLRPEFVLNRPEFREAVILLAGENFGCGSSREHAAWALSGHGFRVVMSRSFADIFYSNALKNGLLPLVLSGEAFARLAQAGGSGEEIHVDLPQRTVAWSDGSFTFTIDSFAGLCLEQGTDQLGYILGFEQQIAAYEAKQGAGGGS